MTLLKLMTLLSLLWSWNVGMCHGGEQPLSHIAIHRVELALTHQVSIKAYPKILGLQRQSSDWVTIDVKNPKPSNDDWIGVFSPAKFSESKCHHKTQGLCTAPVKYIFANFSNPMYTKMGKTSLRLILINQRADFSFAFFTGGVRHPKLVAISNVITFRNPKAPLYPRLAQGKSWDEMTVSWTSGYNVDEAIPFVEWGWEGYPKTRSPAKTSTFQRKRLCGIPARTIGWRHPGFIHTSFLKELRPNTAYTYRLGHLLTNGSLIWSKMYSLRSSPYPGQNSLQRVVIFGDLGKVERDGSNGYQHYRIYGALNTTDQLINDLENIDIVFHIGDLAYAIGYISQWDQFISQVEPVASSVPYMIASGNHERDWPGTGSYYKGTDSGGECGVPAQTMFYIPAEKRDKFWYSTDYGMFHFCIANSEHDWRKGSEQYRFIENCLSSVDRKKQPWLIFATHRVLGYSSDSWYGAEFGEPMGRVNLEGLWQKYKVDIAFYGHVHSYERTCPVYQNKCLKSGRSHYSGVVNGTIHVVVGGAGAPLSTFSEVTPSWSLFRDSDWGFGKLTAFNHSSLLFEYKKSSDGKVYDSFTISRNNKD